MQKFVLTSFYLSTVTRKLKSKKTQNIDLETFCLNCAFPYTLSATAILLDTGESVRDHQALREDENQFITIHKKQLKTVYRVLVKTYSLPYFLVFWTYKNHLWKAVAPPHYRIKITSASFFSANF